MQLKEERIKKKYMNIYFLNFFQFHNIKSNFIYSYKYYKKNKVKS